MSKVSDQMQKEILARQASGLSKKAFIKNKSYSQSKFDYWLKKYNAEPQSGNFEELNMVDPVESKQYSSYSSGKKKTPFRRIT